MVLKLLKWMTLALGALIAAAVIWRWDIVVTVYEQRHMFTEPHFDTTVPTLPAFAADAPKLLIFSKTNGFRHHDAIPASRDMLEDMAETNGWQTFASENNNVFNADVLNRFDLIVLNNSSGTLYTTEQQSAFKAFVESGGGVVALHAAGGDSSYAWDWYVDELIRAQFVDHPMINQFQPAVLKLTQPHHAIFSDPVFAAMGDAWERVDEWYNFAESPSGRTRVLLRIDEATYDPERSPMGEDHPMTWCHTIGAGRVFYTALGHLPETYAEPEYRAMVAAAIRWALGDS